MNWLNQMKIQSKLLTGFGTVTLLILINGVMSHSGLNQVNDASKEAAESVPLVGAANSMGIAIRGEMQMIMEYMKASDEATLGELQNQVNYADNIFNRFSQGILNGLEEEGAHIIASDDPELRKEIEQSMALYRGAFKPRVQAVYDKRLEILQSIAKRNIAKVTMEVGVTQITQMSQKLEAGFTQVIKKRIADGAGAEEILKKENGWASISLQTAIAIAASRIAVEKYIQADLDKLDELEKKYKQSLKDVDVLIKALQEGGTIGGREIIAVDNPEMQQTITSLKLTHEQIFQMGNTILMQIHKRGLELEREIEGLNHAAKGAGGQIILHTSKAIERANANMNSAQNQAEDTASEIQTMGTLVVLLILAMAMVISILISKSITAPVKTMSKLFQDLKESGDFSLRSNFTTPGNEIGQMGSAVNGLLENLQSAIDESNRVVGDVARGVFNTRIQSEFVGDLTTLKQGVNHSAESVERTMNGLSEVMNAITNGNFSYRLEGVDMEESFRRLLITTMETMESAINEINHAMAAASGGDFTQRVKSQLSGDMAALKDGVNESLQNIQEALDEASTVADAIASGDLSQRVNGRYRGRLGELKDALNQSTEQLQQIVSQVNHSAERVANGAQEVNVSSDQLAQRTSQQAASLEETAASMEEMTATVQLNAENAGHANTLSENAHHEATEGTIVVDQAVDAVARIKESSDKITDIISLIDGIAFQTNLLALNAAVEAARAGEQGRGFAVVAGEVRTLAQRSADAAKEISSLIEESSQRVEEGAELVGNTGEALDKIQTAVQKVNNIVKEISTSSNEQSLSIGQVNNAITELEGVNQQNSAMVEESAASSEQLDRQGKKLIELMGFFNQANGSGAAIAAPAADPVVKETTTESGFEGRFNDGYEDM